MRAVSAWTVVACASALSLAPSRAFAQSAQNVAVVVNDESPDSRRIADHYVRVRAIPETHVIRIRSATTEEVSQAVYANAIEAPVRAALAKHGLQDRILYIVLTKGVPLRIQGTQGLEGTVASVDSELALLYRRMTGRVVPTRGRVANPYYLSAQPTTAAQPFSHRAHDIYLVTRLDGFTVEDVLGLIDRAQAPAKNGRFVLDQRAGVLTNPVGDVWLAEANRRLLALGIKDSVLEGTRTPARDMDNVLGYYSWGSNDPEIRVRESGIRFAPGAVAATFAGADARTFKEPPAEWRPSANWQHRTLWFAGAPTSLIGDVIREGASGVAGHVSDPFIQSTVRPEILFPAYASGFNLAEAFYLAIPHLSWQTVVIGDPLCRPFSRELLGEAETAPPDDPTTGLPSFFSARRVEQLRATFKLAPAEAVTQLALYEGRLAHDDRAGARDALEKALTLAPDLPAPQLQLALLYEQERDYPRAAERYEIVLKLQPNNVVALNNLAYSLATWKKAPADAKPLAEKAARLAPTTATIVDTLAWVEYLLGNHTIAARHIAAAIKGAPANPEVRLHAAFIYGALKEWDTALSELKAALDADPELAKREDVQQLQQRLSRKGSVSSQLP